MNTKIIDHHMHTNYSPDADQKATFKAYIKQAELHQIEALVFTDHVDFDSTADIFLDMIDYDAYIKDLKLAQKDTTVDLRLGVEIGYQPHLNDRLHRFLSDYPFDFVICSIHNGDGKDFYEGSFFVGKTQEEAYRRYFEIVLETVKSYDNYDVFGHIDYIIRYGGYDLKMYRYETYKDIIDDILKVIIQKGKGIEINTSGLRYGLGVLHPLLDVLKSYKRLGGTIVTFGSDAHQISDYYAGYDEAIQLLRDAGFKEVTVYKLRKPTFVSIQ